MSSHTLADKRQSFYPMQELIGVRVADNGGNRLGSIAEFLIDGTEGRIAYVRILLDDVPDRRGREVTVPWSSLRVSAHGQSVWQLRAGRSTLGKLRKPGQH